MILDNLYFLKCIWQTLLGI